MTAWFLVVVLAGADTGLPPVTRHPTREDCQRQLAVEVVHLAVTGREVAFAACQQHRGPALRPATGEVLR